jgi:hypothetical protein
LGLLQVKVLEVGEALQCGYVAFHLGLVQGKVLEVGEALQCGYVAFHLGLLQVKVNLHYCAGSTSDSHPFTWISFSFKAEAFQLSCHLLFIGALGCFWSVLSFANFGK